jgi:hypothetical protein
VVDAAGVPVANANVTFGVRGSCVPQVDSQVKTTDAAGFVSITLVSSKPGVVVVIAATTNAAGAWCACAARRLHMHMHAAGARLLEGRAITLMVAG